MDTYRTEEEQVEALKKWWEENGRSTIAAVALALAAGFGWNYWQGYQQQQAESASLLYEEMMASVGQSGEAAQAQTIKTLGERLKGTYPSSTYAQFAALHLARIAVVEGRLEDAEAELRWVLTQGPAPELALLAELRLARVKAALGDSQAALEILAAAQPGAFAAAYAEAEGDIYLDLGDSASAIAAYERALGLAVASQGGASEALRLKLSALTPVPARELAAAAEQ
ncbi:MAG: tetratricopeptide repeat protein [Halieaceae bacterium]|nr:tetratricopeptide repeat protein [Halieaceae bacterium]